MLLYSHYILFFQERTSVWYESEISSAVEENIFTLKMLCTN